MLAIETGVVPSPRDPHDLRFRPSPDAFHRNATFARVVLRHPIAARDQGGEVPCAVSICVVTCLEILEARAGDVTELSAMFHHYVARRDPKRLTSLSLREGLAVAADLGVASQAAHDQAIDAAGAAAAPSEDAFIDARRRRTAYDLSTRRWEYRRVGDAHRSQQVCDAIRRGMPVALAFWLTPAYEAVSRDHDVHPLASRADSNTAHAVVAVGFDNARSQVLVKDSRGTGFASDGHWWFPFPLVDEALVFERGPSTG